ncbi:MAG: DUF4337 domain-containing protein [Acidobacteriota bacterium]|nr:DUF4337 domain-containing protein [Acidobacteriota bacterium]
MAELEIHHEGHESDPLGRKIGILASLLAVLLAVVTIASHRSHTEAVLLKSDVNNTWSFYESKKMKFHSLELGEDILGTLAPKNAAIDKKLERYGSEKARYNREGEEIQKEARAKESEVQKVEHRALFYDIGEGLLEIGLVLTSLYFISKKKLFPALGLIAGVGGAIMALMGFVS